MKKNVLLFALLINSVLFTANAQTVIFQQNFEEETALGTWIIHDLDGLTPQVDFAFIFGGRAWKILAWDSQPDNRVISTTSWFHPAGQADRWLVSPKIAIPTNNITALKFDARSYSTLSFMKDGYSVLVSTTGTNPADFTNELFIIEGEENTWTERSIDLSQFAGQNIHIAWRNNNNMKNMLSLDNIVITATTTASTTDFLASKLSVLPNPVNDVVTITNTANLFVNNITINDNNGRTVKTVKLNEVTEAQVNVSGLNSGIYFMHITTNEGVAVKKIIKK